MGIARNIGCLHRQAEAVRRGLVVARRGTVGRTGGREGDDAVGIDTEIAGTVASGNLVTADTVGVAGQYLADHEAAGHVFRQGKGLIGSHYRTGLVYHVLGATAKAGADGIAGTVANAGAAGLQLQAQQAVTADVGHGDGIAAAAAADGNVVVAGHHTVALAEREVAGADAANVTVEGNGKRYAATGRILRPGTADAHYRRCGVIQRIQLAGGTSADGVTGQVGNAGATGLQVQPQRAVTAGAGNRYRIDAV